MGSRSIGSTVSLSPFQHGGADQPSLPLSINIPPPFAGIFNSSNVHFILQLNVAMEIIVLVDHLGLLFIAAY